MIVAKFGGSASSCQKALSNVKRLSLNEDRKVFVFSAIGRTAKNQSKLTDLLIKYARQSIRKSNKTTNTKDLIKTEIIDKLTTLCKQTNVKLEIKQMVDKYCEEFDQNHNFDYFVSRGEYLTCLIMSKFLNIKFVPAENLIFLKNNQINLQKTEKLLKKQLFLHEKIIISGFYATNETNNASYIKLFKRGGSDYSASIIAKCLGSNLYENWTDVDGIYPINPKYCQSNKIEKLSYQDLATMTKYDAKVIQKDCANLLNGTDTTLEIKNIFTPENPGSVVSSFCNTKAFFIVCKHTKFQTKIFLQLPNGLQFIIKTKK